MAIKADHLAETVAKELRKYASAATEDIKAATDEVAKGCVQELRSTSPKDTGAYSKGWTKKTAFENATSKRQTVHNKTDYQLTHLLEYGHAKHNGGRVPAKPHIKQAEQNAIDLMIKKTKEALKK